MSYLIRDNGGAFTKAVISLWFRVPSASIDSAFKNLVTSPPYPLFNGVMPLLIMGKKGTSGAGGKTHPTYLGVDCSSEGNPRFIVNFESCIMPDIVGMGEDYVPDTGSISGRTGPGQSGVISADHWHHALISVDLGSDVATHGFAFDEDTSVINAATIAHVESLAHLYMAFDDVNVTGAELSGDYPNNNKDINGVWTADASRVADSVQKFERPEDPHEPDFPTGPIPHYVISMFVPDGPMGLPGTTEFVDNIYLVEMAEFQMWLNETIDTGNMESRRAFIDKNGKPVNPRASWALIGRKQDILLHGSGNWKSGKNTGTSPQPFKPVTKINAYTPNPSLRGPQGPKIIR